ncbi:aminotransferase class IV [Pseudonocardia phyllosphaerae]|uniref:aminotransferase class IV n=1 Tax=Pseudonocardia phyllosphaerae TaxID=3390502 RepID=UPI00397842CC
MTVASPDEQALLRALAITGYGHFTTVLPVDGRVRGLDRHLARLREDCRTLFGTELDVDAVRDRVRAVAPASGAVVVRVTVADPDLALGHLGGRASPQFVVSARPAPAGPPRPIRVRAVEHERYLPHVKSVGLFPTMHLRRTAERAGADDVLFTGPGGVVLEGSTWNIGLVRDGTVVWPSGPALPGVTRALLREALPGTVTQTDATVTLAELGGYDAAFATNATGVRPIAAVDGTPFDPGHPVLAQVTRALEQVPSDPL